ncbi:MAG: hypothetical protein IKT22_08970, partial [Prevotella sp.]|nr:hypothetical protein [Prevotella sp.]
ILMAGRWMQQNQKQCRRYWIFYRVPNGTLKIGCGVSFPATLWQATLIKCLWHKPPPDPSHGRGI